MIGTDGHIYLPTRGPIRAVIPITPEKATDRAHLVSVAPWMSPPLPWLSALYHGLHARHKTEVVVYVGHRVDKCDRSRYVAYVPAQLVTSGSVDVDDADAPIAWFASNGYRPCGTIHSHPGSWTDPSGTDETDLFFPLPGVHTIFGRNTTYSSYVSTPTAYWQTISGAPLGSAGRRGAHIHREGGQTLAQLITTPVKPTHGGWWSKCGKSTKVYTTTPSNPRRTIPAAEAQIASQDDGLSALWDNHQQSFSACDPSVDRVWIVRRGLSLLCTTDPPGWSHLCEDVYLGTVSDIMGEALTSEVTIS